MKKNLFAAFEQSKEGAEEPFCACETIAGYVTVSGRKCQVTVKVSAEEDEWLDDEASIKANAHGERCAVAQHTLHPIVGDFDS